MKNIEYILIMFMSAYMFLLKWAVLTGLLIGISLALTYPAYAGIILLMSWELGLADIFRKGKK